MNTSGDNNANLQASELTAYLDGELPDGECREVEDRLARDPEYRQELASLERTWSALDTLPRSEVDDDFTRTTVEMVTVEAEREVDQQARRVPAIKRARTLGGVLLVLAMLMLGFVISAALWPDPDEQLVRDLPVIEHLDLYLVVDDIRFLQLLADKQVFQTDEPIDEMPVAGAVEYDDSRRSRRDYLAELPPESQSRLLGLRDRFLALPESEKTRLRKLRGQIAQSPDRKELMVTLAQYYNWLRDRTAGERADLAALDPEARAQRVAREVTEEQKRREERLAAERRRREMELSAEDRRVVARWVVDQVGKHRERILARFRDDKIRSRLERLDDEKLAWGLLAMSWNYRRWSNGGDRHSPFGEDNSLNPEAIDELRENLSSEARAQLGEVPPERREELVGRWLFSILRERMESRMSGGVLPDVGQAELEQFFAEELSNETRQQLLDMPSEEMQRELRRRYYDAKQGRDPNRDFDDGPDRPHFFPGRPGSDRRGDGWKRPGPRRPGRNDLRPKPGDSSK